MKRRTITRKISIAIISLCLISFWSGEAKSQWVEPQAELHEQPKPQDPAQLDPSTFINKPLARKPPPKKLPVPYRTCLNSRDDILLEPATVSIRSGKRSRIMYDKTYEGAKAKYIFTTSDCAQSRIWESDNQWRCSSPVEITCTLKNITAYSYKVPFTLIYDKQNFTQQVTFHAYETKEVKWAQVDLEDKDKFVPFQIFINKPECGGKLSIHFFDMKLEIQIYDCPINRRTH